MSVVTPESYKYLVIPERNEFQYVKEDELEVSNGDKVAQHETAKNVATSQSIQM